MIQVRAPKDILIIVKRRYRYLLIPFVLGLAASIAAIQFWPPTYRSVATILLQDTSIPEDFIGTAVDTYADDRVQVISQRVMTTANLMSIVERLNLYGEDRLTKAPSQIAGKMRKNIHLELVNAEGTEQRNSRRAGQTIAFRLSFDYGDPDTAQTALGELVALYLGENVRTRRERVSETVELLAREVDNHRQYVERLEAQLAAFKQENAGKLPDQIEAKQRQNDEMKRELLDITNRLQALDEKRAYLAAQLAQIDPTDVPAKDKAQWTAADKLRALQSEYLTLSSRYGTDHPDVQRAKRELEALEAEVGGEFGRTALEAQRDALRSQLATLAGTYSPAHPEVLKVKRELAAVDEKLRNLPVDYPQSNPLYVQLNAQLAAANAEYRSLLEQRTTRQDMLEKQEDDIREGPQIEREYRSLLREYDSAVATYTDVQAKKQRAELGQAMEEQKKTEQFDMLEAPSLPIEPAEPEATLILAIGTILSLTMAVGAAVLSEVMDYSVYGARQLTEIAGVPPLAVIPRIRTRTDIFRSWKIRAAGAVGGLILIALILLSNPDLLEGLNVLLGHVGQEVIGFGASGTLDS